MSQSRHRGIIYELNFDRSLHTENYSALRTVSTLSLFTPLFTSESESSFSATLGTKEFDWYSSLRKRRSEEGRQAGEMAQLIGKLKEKAVDKLSQVPKPSCELSDLDFKDVSRKNVTIAGIVSIHNPYDHDLPICTITYKILSNNREIGSGQLTDPGDIRANDKTDIELPTTVPYDFLWNLMKDIGADWDIDYKFEVGVQFKLPIVGKFTLPLSTTGTMKLPTLSDIF